jgi:hypothetical protein
MWQKPLNEVKTRLDVKYNTVTTNTKSGVLIKKFGFFEFYEQFHLSK